MTEPWKPRRHDHLVEPMFAGLEVEPPRVERSLHRRWWLALALLGVVAFAIWRVIAAS